MHLFTNLMTFPKSCVHFGTLLILSQRILVGKPWLEGGKLLLVQFETLHTACLGKECNTECPFANLIFTKSETNKAKSKLVPRYIELPECESGKIIGKFQKLWKINCEK